MGNNGKCVSKVSQSGSQTRAAVILRQRKGVQVELGGLNHSPNVSHTHFLSFPFCLLSSRFISINHDKVLQCGHVQEDNALAENHYTGRTPSVVFFFERECLEM